MKLKPEQWGLGAQVTWTESYFGTQHLAGIPFERGQATVTDHPKHGWAEAWVHVHGTSYSVPGDSETFHGPDACAQAKRWAEERARALGWAKWVF